MVERQFNILINMDDGEWARPMDVGGYDSSHHSNTMIGMVKRGWLEKKRRYVGVSGGSNLYRITQDGRAALAAAIRRRKP